MKRTSASCRASGLVAVKIEAEHATENLGLTTTIALLNKTPASGVLASSKYKGPWPASVVKALNELKDQIEEHLLTVYFEENSNDANNTRATNTKPKGIIEPPVECSEHRIPQL